MKKIILFLIVTSIFQAADLKAETSVTKPHWSIEVKGGLFIPDFDEWSSYYGRRNTSQYGGSLAYKILRQVEVGIEGTLIRDKGQGFGSIHQTPAGDVKIELAPLNVFVLARGLFKESQWIVPYVGGGWTRMFYREEIEHQSVTRGSVDGYHARGGIQLLLDAIDTSAATNMYVDYGVDHTYLFLEAQYTRAMADTAATTATGSQSVNLGGISWLAGLLFEF